MRRIVIIDYGVGNLRSIANKLRRMEYDAVVSEDGDEILRADRLILPGVGFFARGMQNLVERGLLPAMEDAVLKRKIPILGICLGAQLFAAHSEEGDADGLGWLDADIRKFRFDSGTEKLKVPHVGWNAVEVRNDSPLVAGRNGNARFYFTHSYYIRCNRPEDVVAVTHYGHDFASIVARENIHGVQFHPEKSHGFGVALIRNFIERC